MLGRGVAEQAADDPAAALSGIRDQLEAADLAAANLESPLTERPHSTDGGPNALEAAPASAAQLAAAGLDVVAVANNHAGDAGPGTVTDTLTAVDAAGLTAVGGGLLDEAFAPDVVQVQGVSVAMLALDTTEQGPRASTTVPVPPPDIRPAPGAAGTRHSIALASWQTRCRRSREPASRSSSWARIRELKTGG